MYKNKLSVQLRDIVRPITTVVRVDDTIEEALTKIQEHLIEQKVIYFYVLDSQDRLIGIVPTRKLLLATPKTKISSIMEDAVIRLYDDQTLQQAVEIFARHSLLALPVVNREGKFLGIVDVEMYMEESFDIANARHRADIFQIIGLSLEEEKTANVARNYRLRMPWIFCSMIGGVLCAIISYFYSLILAKTLVLAMFIPLVLSLSESVSMQSMAHSLQFIHRPRLTWKLSFLKALKEWRLVSLIAMSGGLIVGLISLFWGDGLLVSTTIGFGIMISIVISSLFGILLPICLRKLQLDPKVASGPVVLMLADVFTITVYLSLASWWLL